MNKWSLNRKMILIVCIFVFACAVVSYEGITNMNSISNSLERIVHEESVRIEEGEAIRGIFRDLIIDEKNIIIEVSKEGMDKAKANFDKHLEQLEYLVSDLHSKLLPAGKKNLDDFNNFKKTWVENNKLIQKHSYANDKNAAYLLSIGEQRELRGKMEDLLKQIIERNKKRMEASAIEADHIYESSRKIMISTSILSILFGVAIAFYVLKKLDTAINQVINHLTDNSTQVSSAAQQIASSSVELSQATTEQSASLEQTSASVEEMNSMVQKNADNAKKSSALSEQSKNGANNGRVVVQDMIKAIQEINQSNEAIKVSIDESNQQFSEIVTVINEIGNKTKVINDIVFQTKLLSFNASVEAARAGDHGKGFAVVAEEVGNLAQMSGNAATEISSMLEASTAKVESIVRNSKAKIETLITEGNSKVEKGALIAQECGKVLEDIVGNVTSVSQMSEEISDACQEQAQGVSEITKAMAQLDQVTQTNAATSEQAAQSAEELSVQAKSLRSVVDVLVATIKGSKNGVEISEIARIDKNITSDSVTKSILKYQNDYKKAAGSEYTPNHNDKRFTDV